MTFSDIANIVAVVAGLAAIASLVWIARRPDADRADEDSARDFFDRHGHWPDEAPGAPLDPPAA